MATPPFLQRAPTEREILANQIAQRLDRPVGFLGILALILWLAEPLTKSQPTLTFSSTSPGSASLSSSLSSSWPALSWRPRLGPSYERTGGSCVLWRCRSCGSCESCA